MNSLIVIALLAAIAVVNAGDLGFGHHAGHFPVGLNRGNYAFHGHYPGQCGNDGFYYKDHYSFVICSNGNAYDQPCAPGTRNSEYGRYNSGHAYHYRDFCDVNLVDYGFGAHHSAGYGQGHGHAAAYVAPAYGAHVAHVAHGAAYGAAPAHVNHVAAQYY